MEARYDYFAKRLADFVVLYGQLKAQTFHIEQLKWQVIKAVKPANSLSQLLKNVYINGPGNHFPGASHVLPIIVLDSVSRQYDPELAALAHQQANLVSASVDNTFSQHTGLGQALPGGDMLSEIAPTTQNTVPHHSGFASSQDALYRPQFYRWVEQKLAFFY